MAKPAKPDGQWHFSIEWQNTGRIPIKNMQSWIEARYFPGEARQHDS